MLSSVLGSHDVTPPLGCQAPGRLPVKTTKFKGQPAASSLLPAFLSPSAPCKLANCSTGAASLGEWFESVTRSYRIKEHWVYAPCQLLKDKLPTSGTNTLPGPTENLPPFSCLQVPHPDAWRVPRSPHNPGWGIQSTPKRLLDVSRSVRAVGLHIEIEKSQASLCLCKPVNLVCMTYPVACHSPLTDC